MPVTIKALKKENNGLRNQIDALSKELKNLQPRIDVSILVHDVLKTRSLPALQIGILQDTESGCDVAIVLFFRLPPNLDSGLTS